MCSGIINLHRNEVGEVTSKEDFITTAALITRESKEVIKMAKQVATFCRDEQINKVSKTLFI